MTSKEQGVAAERVGVMLATVELDHGGARSGLEKNGSV